MGPLISKTLGTWNPSGPQKLQSAQYIRKIKSPNFPNPADDVWKHDSHYSWAEFQNTNSDVGLRFNSGGYGKQSRRKVINLRWLWASPWCTGSDMSLFAVRSSRWNPVHTRVNIWPPGWVLVGGLSSPGSLGCSCEPFGEDRCKTWLCFPKFNSPPLRRIFVFLKALRLRRFLEDLCCSRPVFKCSCLSRIWRQSEFKAVRCQSVCVFSSLTSCPLIRDRSAHDIKTHLEPSCHCWNSDLCLMRSGLYQSSSD